MNSLITNNPIIQRYRFSVMRPRQFGIYLTVYIIIMLLLLLINIGAESDAASVFSQLVVFQLVLLWIWAAHNTYSAVRDEVTDKTYDFFRMLPLSPHQKATGILIGKNLVALLFAAINSVFLVFFALPTIKTNHLLQLILMLACGAFCINAVALLSSIRAAKRRQRSGNLVLLLMLLFCIGPMIGIVGELADSNWGSDTDVQFYKVKLPILLFVAVTALYLGCWAYEGIIRKFTKENQCLFTRLGAVFFFISCQLILLGLFLPHFPGEKNRDLNYVFWTLSLVPALLISLGAIRTFDDYWDNSKTLTGLTPARFFTRVFLFSNTGLAVLLFVLWTPFAAISATKTGLANTHTYLLMAVLFLFYMFIVSLMELWSLYRPDSEKIAVLLVAVGFIYFIVPPICASVFEFELLSTASPVGLLIYLCDEGPLATTELAGLLLYHLMLCALPAIKIAQKYDKIRQLRASIDN